ncbi:hypothetical protein QR685DRAFT_335106 [Neurospora intermedia]|uniref:Uncharacterized protein n=1 Tax=Neurospora intermedia TaxID=5142 RepID=A0ABR3D6I6_NEUIN
MHGMIWKVWHVQITESSRVGRGRYCRCSVGKKEGQEGQKDASEEGTGCSSKGTEPEAGLPFTKSASSFPSSFHRHPPLASKTSVGSFQRLPSIPTRKYHQASDSQHQGTDHPPPPPRWPQTIVPGGAEAMNSPLAG